MQTSETEDTRRAADGSNQSSDYSATGECARVPLMCRAASCTTSPQNRRMASRGGRGKQTKAPAAPASAVKKSIPHPPRPRWRLSRALLIHLSPLPSLPRAHAQRSRRGRLRPWTVPRRHVCATAAPANCNAGGRQRHRGAEQRVVHRRQQWAPCTS